MNPPERTLRVLVVDDEEIIATSLADILNQRGFSAVAAFSGIEAIERAKYAPFDVLVSDLVMPIMGGIELSLEICRIIPDCRVILFSGNAVAIHLLAKAHQNGHDFEIHQKPLHPSVLVDRLRELAVSEANWS